MVKFIFKTSISRRMPDPVFKGCQRHILLCRVVDVPHGLPKDPNPRAQNTDRHVWKEIKSHLLNEVGSANTFHLKNKGITLLANDVREIPGKKDEWEISFKSGIHGIVDGAHSYDLVTKTAELIRERQKLGAEIDQYVKFEVLTGFDGDIHAEIAGGLNTAIQVQEMSLANLSGKFKWIEDALEGQPYAKRIAFRENEKDCFTDVRDLIAILFMFNIDAFPNDEKGEHPVAAYTNKARTLDHYLREENTESYRKLREILPDILRLHDIVAAQARDLHNEAGGKGASLSFVEHQPGHEMPYTGELADFRLSRAALYPMLGAFRWLVVQDPDSGMFTWRRGFEGTLAVWEKVGHRLMKQTQATSDENNRRAHAIGRSANHWATLYSTVAMADLMGQSEDVALRRKVAKKAQQQLPLVVAKQVAKPASVVKKGRQPASAAKKTKTTSIALKKNQSKR